jgi:hypothetical protein
MNKKGCRSRQVRMSTVAIVAVAVALAVASAASAQITFSETGAALTEEGLLTRQAGAHPDFTTKAAIASGSNPEITEESLHDLSFELPPGLIGNPTSVPECSFEDLSRPSQASFCKPESQVGEARIELEERNGFPAEVGIFNLKHSPDVPALFGFNYLRTIVLITPEVRPGDYGITATGAATSQAQTVFSAELTFWGVPADPSHDAQRESEFISNLPSSAPRLPFMTAPTSCPGVAASFTARMDSWQHMGSFTSTTFDTERENGVPFLFGGCEALPFAPSLSAQLTSRAAGQPTGLNVEIHVPQNSGPDGLATSDLRKAVVTLPPGMAVSPSSASGLGACGQAEMGIGSNAPPTCPDSSKIGRVTIKTPLLEEPLKGDVILAKQGDNPFGTLLALYLAVPGPGLYLKLPGKVAADPVTGQLTVSFSDTPQLPFEELEMELDSGSRAPLVNPSSCGTYSLGAEFTPWSGTATRVGQASLTVDQGCAGGGFKPTFDAGTVNATGGSFSPFVLRVTRNDNEQNLSKIVAQLPEGLLAKLAGVTVCGDAQAASGNCPAASQVGQATVGAGPGSNPVFVPEAGKAPTAVYLGGPYKGGPYSLIVKVPAQAGPFDLGTVVVRNSLKIDPVTTQVTTESDPLPQILEGIPIGYRDVRIEINRPDFTVNPTSCESKKVMATLSGSGGATASPTAPFAAVNCEALGLEPKLAVKFSGAPTRRGGHPKLTATLTTKAGNSNLKQVQVTLPKTEFLENAHIKTVCTRVQYAASQCPAKSIYGYARAWTPLLDQPLEGPVYLRSSSHKLPDLVASLSGAIHVDLDGRIDSVNERIRNTFETVPDAPVSKFVLTMQGGGKGLLVNNTNLCKAKPTANVKFDGQNGKAAETNPRVSVAGCGKAKAKKKPKPKKSK